MNNYNKLINNLETLGLPKFIENIEKYIEFINSGNKTVVDALYELTEYECNMRTERAMNACVKVANFPFLKTFDDFNFSFQPSINKEQILNYKYLQFIENKENIIFIGSPGVGKTHLATSIGIEAASQRISTYFINFAQLMEKFKRAAKENRVEQVVKHYLKYTVLIIDEIGYLPVDKAAAYGFFQLIAARYEFRPTILTTNQSFSKWPDVFGDAVIANAIIDRLVHHCEIIKITGHSYRVKDRNLFDEDAEVKL